MKGLFLAVLTLLAVVVGGPARAQQDLQRIAAVVNDQVISYYDLSGRIRLIVASSGLPDTPETRQRLGLPVLRTLIDETLQLQEAKRLNITVSSGEIEQAIGRIAKQNDMTAEQFNDTLKKEGIPLSAVAEQVRAAIAWSKLVAQKIRPSVEISDEQVQDYLARLKASADKPQFRLQEIFLAVDSLQQQDEVRHTAERLAEQVRQGANFAALARQFSQSATAAVGGDLGWVQEGALEPELERVAANLKVDELSEPVRTLAGYHLLLLRDRREGGGIAAETAQISFEHIFLPNPPDAKPDDVAALRSLAQTISESAASCADLAAMRKRLPDAKTVLPATVAAKDLSPQLRAEALKLPIGKAGEPLTINNGVFVMMVCKREGDDGLPDDAQVRARIGQQKLDLLTRRYLRDLRTAAFLDVRA